LLDEVEAVLLSTDLVIDACRRAVRGAGRSVTLANRPVLFALVRALAEAWPHDVRREDLIACAFEARRANASHRARLRVELGRLRGELRALADVRATARGFVLAPRRAPAVVVVVPPIDGDGAAILALLADGEPWSTSALALALGQSQRTVQRALAELELGAKVHARGVARARRWLAPPISGFTTTLLLPITAAIG
jgi:DNA-binding transcriptional ArsR family regulator